MKRKHLFLEPTSFFDVCIQLTAKCANEVAKCCAPKGKCKRFERDVSKWSYDDPFKLTQIISRCKECNWNNINLTGNKQTHTRTQNENENSFPPSEYSRKINEMIKERRRQPQKKEEIKISDLFVQRTYITSSSVFINATSTYARIHTPQLIALMNQRPQRNMHLFASISFWNRFCMHQNALFTFAQTTPMNRISDRRSFCSFSSLFCCLKKPFPPLANFSLLLSFSLFHFLCFFQRLFLIGAIRDHTFSFRALSKVF